MTLNIQLMTMISMVIGGFYLGIAHDTYERFAYLWKRRRLVAYVFAIVFWLVQAFIIFYLLYRTNYGELRVYVFLACLLGLAIYQVFASQIYQRFLNGLLTLFKKIYSIILAIISVLIIQPIRFLLRLLSITIRFVKHILMTLLKVLLFPLQRILKGIYQLLPEKIKKIFNKNGFVYSIIEFIYSKLQKIISFIRR